MQYFIEPVGASNRLFLSSVSNACPEPVFVSHRQNFTPKKARRLLSAVLAINYAQTLGYEKFIMLGLSGGATADCSSFPTFRLSDFPNVRLSRACLG